MHFLGFNRFYSALCLALHGEEMRSQKGENTTVTVVTKREDYTIPLKIKIQRTLLVGQLRAEKARAVRWATKVMTPVSMFFL